LEEHLANKRDAPADRIRTGHPPALTVENWTPKDIDRLTGLYSEKRPVFSNSHADFDITLSSLSTDVASVDTTGNIQANKAGFSTLTPA
jgi:hypothetical protein